MQAWESKYGQEGIDSKALLVCFLQKLPYLLLMGVAGAVLGSGLYLLIAVMTSEGTRYQAETEYYIDFADGRLEAKDYYNDFTWNDVMATDLILGNAMELLGTDYVRQDVKAMIRADILSDVRYLTITITGTDTAKVGAVSSAIAQSLEAFGGRMEEFDAIEQIEDNGVIQVKEPLFTWRAALLGALCGVLAGIFWIAAAFSMGSWYYTKLSVEKSLGIPVFGLLYQEENHADGVQEKGLCLALQKLMEDMPKDGFVITDVLEQGDASRLKDKLCQLDAELTSERLLVQSVPILEKEAFETIRQTNGVILAIPFGKPCKEAALEQIIQLENQKCRILGAVFVDVDRRWMRLYGIR